jgi:hypothetical protein
MNHHDMSTKAQNPYVSPRIYAIGSSVRGQGLRLAGPRRTRGFAGDLVPPQPLLLLLVVVVVVLRLPLRVVLLVVRRRHLLVVVLLRRRSPAAAVAHARRVPGAGVH